MQTETHLTVNLKLIMQRLEQQYLHWALGQTKTKAHAARLLGLGRTTFLMKLKKYGIH